MPSGSAKYGIQSAGRQTVCACQSLTYASYQKAAP